MTSSQKWHRHIGVYGICRADGDERILLVKKAHGPYRGRYDLPGGSLKLEKSLVETLQAEFWEETGSAVEVLQNLGTYDFLVQVPHKDTTHTHHIAVLYEVRFIGLDPSWSLQSDLLTTDGQEKNDSAGAVWVPLADLTAENSSPLVQKALAWLRHETLASELLTYDPWTVKETLM